MAGVSHLVRRFFGSLRPGGPPRADVDWVSEQLLPSELELWSQMSGPDRRHSAVVGRRVERSLGSDTDRAVIAAALLHDVGKSVSGLRTYGRVVATLSARAAGHDMAHEWSRRGGFIRRVGLYLRHDELGGDLLYMAGSDPVTIAWAREHHLAAEAWTVPVEIGEALKGADDD